MAFAWNFQTCEMSVGFVKGFLYARITGRLSREPSFFLVLWGSSPMGDRMVSRGSWSLLFIQTIILGVWFVVLFWIGSRRVPDPQNWTLWLWAPFRNWVSRCKWWQGGGFYIYQVIQFLCSSVVVNLWYAQSIWSNWQSRWAIKGPFLLSGWP